jgi:hypothetical protein
MDEQARRQTTKGIWMSRAVESGKKAGPNGMGKNILVMDVEGTDGRERGEDQDFERKSALFALATSEVLVSFITSRHRYLRLRRNRAVGNQRDLDSNGTMSYCRTCRSSLLTLKL